MLKITYWARAHVWTSRIIIIFLIYPLLNITGWFLGDVLAFNGIEISQSWGYPLSFIILFLFLIYPFHSDKKRYPFYYAWKKTTDVLMILTTFCFIVMRGNGFNSESNNGFANTSYAATAIKSVDPKPSLKLKKSQKNFIKNLVKNFREKYRHASKDDKTGMIILAVFVAVLLVFLLSLLTCSIACSGAEALAYVVLFLGLGGIIFGLVRVIQRIKRGKPREKKVVEPSQG